MSGEDRFYSRLCSIHMCPRPASHKVGDLRFCREHYETIKKHFCERKSGEKDEGDTGGA